MYTAALERERELPLPLVPLILHLLLAAGLSSSAQRRAIAVSTASPDTTALLSVMILYGASCAHAQGTRRASTVPLWAADLPLLRASHLLVGRLKLRRRPSTRWSSSRVMLSGGRHISLPVQAAFQSWGMRMVTSPRDTLLRFSGWDALARLKCADVRRDALRQLRIRGHELVVTKSYTSSFLLKFASSQLRDAAWARQRFRSTARLSISCRGIAKLVCALRGCQTMHIRLSQSCTCCLSGLLWMRLMIRGRRGELGWFVHWLWCKDPDVFATAGTIQVEDPF
jgi:hypothetical protein